MTLKILGWKFQPSFNNYSKTVDMVSDKQSIKESLYVLLNTVPGERLMTLGYGCDLNYLAFKNLDSNLITLVQNNIKSAIARWEKRIDNVDVVIKQDSTCGEVIDINISYRIKNTEENDSYLFTYTY